MRTLVATALIGAAMMVVPAVANAAGTNPAGAPQTSKRLISLAPVAPGPLAGVGLLPALAAFGALVATRARRRKTALG